MRLLKTIGIQYAISIAVFATLELIRTLWIGKFDLTMRQMLPYTVFMLIITLGALMYDRPAVKEFAQTPENMEALEEWLNRNGAKPVASESNVKRYKISMIRAIDGDITVEIENDIVRVEGVVRLITGLKTLV